MRRRRRRRRRQDSCICTGPPTLLEELNGEKVVFVVIVAGILFTIPAHLFSLSLSLSLALFTHGGGSVNYDRLSLEI